MTTTPKTDTIEDVYVARNDEMGAPKWSIRLIHGVRVRRFMDGASYSVERPAKEKHIAFYLGLIEHECFADEAAARRRLLEYAARRRAALKRELDAIPTDEEIRAIPVVVFDEDKYREEGYT